MPGSVGCMNHSVTNVAYDGKDPTAEAQRV